VLRNRWLWLCALAGACALPGPAPWLEWRSEIDRDHPLAGRVIDVRAGREIEPAVLLERLRAARFVLLGEKHDNPDHHRLQAWVVEGLARAGQRRGLAFEMLPQDSAAALAAAAPRGVDAIPAAVDWEHLGWPEWALYRPLFEAALAAGFPVFPADLERSQLADLRRGGAPPDSLVALGLDRPLEPGALVGLREDLVRSHCGALPEPEVERMLGIQRARDAQLAAALAAAAQEDGAVLIAGAAHVRRTSGVPVYLARAAPGTSVVALALAEVVPGARDLEATLGRERDLDYLWMTPRVDDQDPCERFRRQLERLRSGSETSKILDLRKFSVAWDRAR
jgi:uncharacterized iron-regulated protein